MDYAPDKVVFREAISLDELLNLPKPDWARVRWINIDGLHPYTVRLISQKYDIHPLAAEDILHTPQRPRFEPYNNDVFLLTRMLRFCEGKLMSEQVSLFMNQDTLITFQETHGDVWDPIRKRIQTEGSRLRKYDASYLIYALLDAMVDHYFPLLEHYSDQLDDLEDQILGHPDVPVLNTIHSIKSELAVLRRVIWPMRKVASDLQQCDLAVVSEVSRTYLRDVDEHCLQIVEVIETFRETAAGLTDLHMSVISNRMNETMKVLTIMASLFIPITFMAGVYGMNFDWMPELRWRYGYPVFLLACALVVTGLLMYFRHRGWLGSRSKDSH
ncbi:MAG: magnesium/cobalt transporter CorA [Phycisphaeraceae bacterium]